MHAAILIENSESIHRAIVHYHCAVRLQWLTLVHLTKILNDENYKNF